MDLKLKALLEQTSPSELVEVQKFVSTLLRGGSGANPNKVKPLKRTGNTASAKPLRTIHFTEEFFSKALAKIFFEVFHWQIGAAQVSTHRAFKDAHASCHATFGRLQLPNTLFYPVLKEACEIIKRKQEQSPNDLSSYTVFDKLNRIDELLFRAHPAAKFVKNYFQCLAEGDKGG